MSKDFDAFKNAANFGQPRLALALLVPIIQSLIDRISEMENTTPEEASTAPSRKVTKGPKANPVPKEEEPQEQQAE